jgi:DNA-binding transcriptional LysR family regulator
MKLRQLEHALELARQGNFRRAAVKLNISQPALSRSIGALEVVLGVSLFNRLDEGVTATVYGEVLLSHASQLTKDAHDLVRELESLQTLDHGSLSISMGAYASELSGTGALGELLTNYPKLKITFSISKWTEVADQVLNRDVDIGYVETALARDQANLQVESIGRHQMVVYCRATHPLLQLKKVTDEDLKKYPLIGPRMSPNFKPVVGTNSDDFKSGDSALHIRSDDISAARSLVAECDGFGCAPPVALAKWLASGELAVPAYNPTEHPWLRLNYGFVYLQNRALSPAAMAWMDIVRRREQKISARNEEMLQELFAPASRRQAKQVSQAYR